LPVIRLLWSIFVEVNTQSTIKNRENLAVGFPSGPNGALKDVASELNPEDQISFASELIRKSIHLASLTIPIIYYYVNRETALAFLLPMALVSIGIDVGRYHVQAIKHLVERMFNKILRPHERRAGLLSGATYVLISALICVTVFPKLITVTAFSILILSDSSSALFGRAFGKHRFFDKSREGTFAFIVTAWIVVMITPKAGPLAIEYVIGGVAAIVGGLAEAASVSLHLDDNFSVPVSIGLTMWGLYWLLSILDPASYGALYQALLHFS
jgi:dolichol kinase